MSGERADPLQIADAIAAELNGAAAGTFALKFAAGADYAAQHTIEELQDRLAVTVVPRESESRNLTRGENEHDWSIDIGIERGIQGEEDGAKAKALCDALMLLAQQVEYYLARRAMAGAKWVAAAREPAWDPDRLRNERIFATVITVTYRFSVDVN